MKKRIIITAVLAVLCSSTNALMAASVDAYQKGNSNQLTVTQSGVMQSSTAIDQNGYGIATITQVGSGGATANDLQIIQDGATLGTENKVTLTQNKGGNSAVILQTTIATPATVGNGLNSTGSGASFSNTANITQDGINNTQAQITQAGNTNTAILNQDSANSGSISQSGSANIATVDQRETVGIAGSNATNDTATVFQQGSNGTVTVTQAGAAAFNDVTITQDATSSDATATVTQSGAFNIADITQSNTFNEATVTQDGTGAGATYATGGNEIIIVQDGASLSGASDTVNAEQHTGNTNQITITQHRGDGSVVNVIQNGSLNTATVTQN
jgi:hypothetical protein